VLREAHERARAELLAQGVAVTATLEAQVLDRTRALEAANRALAEAQRVAAHQRRMAALGQLASALAHEVANPLNFSVGGAAELVRRVTALRGAIERGDDDGARAALRGAERALELVQGGNARIRGVLDGLRTYTRGGGGEAEPVDVLAVARATVSLMDERLRAQGVAVTVTDRELPRVRGRQGELGQVFMNLFLNAAQAMPGGGAVTVDGAVRGDRVEVTVADDGPGVPRERRSEVFEPYVTTRAAEGGTGLGLAVSHEIARQLGGDLRLVESERGATFVLSLPPWADEAP
jgi:two-component system NtrC family sensor kinase